MRNIQSYNTYILGENCEGYDKGTYDESNSDTFEVFGNFSSVFETYWTANMSTDTFRFNEVEIKEYQFMNGIEINVDYNCHEIYCDVLTEPGILGFLIQPHRNAQYEIFKFNFIKQLKEKDLIKQYDFYFDFNSNDSGNIIIGKFPNETNNKYYNDNIYSTIRVLQADKYRLDWALKFDELYYGEEKIIEEVEGEVIIRVEFGLIIGNYYMEKYVEKYFFDKLVDDKKCFRNNNYKDITFSYYYCNKDVNLNNFKPMKLTLNSFETNFTFTKEDLFLDIGDKYLFLMGFSSSTQSILGYPFLKKYQIIFNQDTKTLGYFHKSKEEMDDNLPVGYIVIIIIFSVILIGLGISGFICFFKYKKKKKKIAEELSDDSGKANNNEGLIPNEENN